MNKSQIKEALRPYSMKLVGDYIYQDSDCYGEQDSDYAVAFILDDKVLINADNFIAAGSNFPEEFNRVTVSLRCLSRFDDPLSFKLIDSTSDDTKYRKTKPGPGYVNLGRVWSEHSVVYHWHRSSYSLLQHKTKGYCVLMGVDDDQYFGCELPYPVNSLEKAKESLVPRGIKNIKYQRQGEWFIVPSKYTPQEMGYEPIKTYSEMAFPLLGRNRTNESNDHMLNTYAYCWVNDDFNMNGGKPILMAEGIDLGHDQHRRISYNGWVFFLENMAVRSFSEAGVD